MENLKRCGEFSYRRSNSNLNLSEFAKRDQAWLMFRIQRAAAALPVGPTLAGFKRTLIQFLGLRQRLDRKAYRRYLPLVVARPSHYSSSI